MSEGRTHMRKLLVIALLFAACSAGLFAAGKAALGTEENPIIWAFVPSGDTQKVSAGAQSVAALLHDRTGLFFKTLVATEYAGVIEALRADPPMAHMASLATAAYIMAADMGVAQAALVSVRNASAFYNGQIVTRAGSGIKKLSDLKGKTFARVDALSASGWIVPMITLRAAGIDPERDIKVVDAGNHPGVVSAVYNGDVDAGACFVDARSLIQKDHPDVMEKVVVIQVSAPIPNDGVQFHPSIPGDLQQKIVSGLLAIAKTENGKKAINAAYQ
jgi:phosphonate transport system substrate-binding protein